MEQLSIKKTLQKSAILLKFELSKIAKLTGKVKYEFSAKTWHYGSVGWYFVTLPVEMSQEIRNLFKTEEEGWGRLKMEAQIGKTTWKTAIWFDTKNNSYLLPLKAEIRKRKPLRQSKHHCKYLYLRTVIPKHQSKPLARVPHSCLNAINLI